MIILVFWYLFRGFNYEFKILVYIFKNSDFLITDIKTQLNISSFNAISKYISKKGPGIHHLAFEVDDIYKSMADMKEKGFQLLSETPKQGADNKLICFLHPKTTNGVLVELCQTMK